MNSNYHKEIISRSHQRSKEFGVEKERIYSKRILPQNQLQKILENSNSLLQLSMPFIENIYKIYSESFLGEENIAKIQEEAKKIDDDPKEDSQS